MKSMKLYDRVQRVYKDLEARGIGPDAPLHVSQLAAFDQYHYFGTEAVDEAIATLGLKRGMRVLDIGAGIGGPARYIAEKTGAKVTALELQDDLSEVGTDLTRRCNLSHLVEHRTANVLDGIEGKYDAIVSMLCFLHIPDRARLFAVCRTAMNPGAKLYIEDYSKHRDATPDETEALAVKVQCSYLPSTDEYRRHLVDAGFRHVKIDDVTQAWTTFTTSRLQAYREQRDRNIALHGVEMVNGLDDFYATVTGLFSAGFIAGLKITAA